MHIIKLYIVHIYVRKMNALHVANSDIRNDILPAVEAIVVTSSGKVRLPSAR